LVLIGQRAFPGAKARALKANQRTLATTAKAATARRVRSMPIPPPFRGRPPYHRPSPSFYGRSQAADGSRPNCAKRSGRVGALLSRDPARGLRPVPKSPHGSFPALCGLPQEGAVPASAPQCSVTGSINPAAARSAIEPRYLLYQRSCGCEECLELAEAMRGFWYNPTHPFATSASSISCHPEADRGEGIQNTREPCCARLHTTTANPYRTDQAPELR